MGAFNVVVVPDECTDCGARIERRVQFKWGDTWLLEYRLGDTLSWGGNDVGAPGRDRVVIEAAAEDCPACGAEGPEGDVVVEQDVLVAWRPEADVGEYAATLRDDSAQPADRAAAAAFLGEADGEPARATLLAAGRDPSLPPDVADAVGRALRRVEVRGYSFETFDFADLSKRVYDAYCEA